MRFKFFCLAATLSSSGRVRTAALLPSASQSGDQSCSLGWAGGGGTLRGFGSALIRVIITTGHTDTLAVVFAAGVGPDSCSFPPGQRC